MPIYEVTTIEGTLDDVQRARLATEITRVHTEETGGPAEIVSVIYRDLPAGRAYRAGKPSSPNMIQAVIRAGRTLETRQSIIKRLNDFYVDLTGVAVMNLVVSVDDIPAEWAMEGGKILPEPTPEKEAAWLAESGTYGG